MLLDRHRYNVSIYHIFSRQFDTFAYIYLKYISDLSCANEIILKAIEGYGYSNHYQTVTNPA